MVCYKNKEILSIIPARLGSSELKNKNIKTLGGKPLIYYTIKASLKSKVSRTIVSTDNIKIANIAKKFGAEAPFLRPKKYSTRNSSSIGAVLHCLKHIKQTEDYVPDIVVFLQPTSPFRDHNDINNGLEIFLKTNATSVAGIVKVSQHPFWMFIKNKKGKLHELIKKNNKPQRRQDLPDVYFFNDSLYISKIEYFTSATLKHPIVDIHNMHGVEMSQLHSFDINSKLDFELAKKLIKNFSSYPL